MLFCLECDNHLYERRERKKLYITTRQWSHNAISGSTFAHWIVQSHTEKRITVRNNLAVCAVAFTPLASISFPLEIHIYMSFWWNGHRVIGWNPLFHNERTKQHEMNHAQFLCCFSICMLLPFICIVHRSRWSPVDGIRREFLHAHKICHKNHQSKYGERLRGPITFHGAHIIILIWFTYLDKRRYIRN